jgi:hypothetical protein
MSKRLSILLVLCAFAFSGCIDDTSPEGLLKSSIRSFKKNSDEKNMKLIKGWFIESAASAYGTTDGLAQLKSAVGNYAKYEVTSVANDQWVVLEEGRRAYIFYRADVNGVDAQGKPTRIANVRVRCNHEFNDCQDEATCSRMSGWYDSRCVVVSLDLE